MEKLQRSDTELNLVTLHSTVLRWRGTVSFTELVLAIRSLNISLQPHFTISLSLSSLHFSSKFHRLCESMSPRSDSHALTHRLLTLRRTSARPEIAFIPIGSSLGTAVPSEVELTHLDIVSPGQCTLKTREAIQNLLGNAIPRWRWVSSPLRKLQKPSRTHLYQRAWTHFQNRDIGMDEDILILVDRETLDSVDAELERPLSQLDWEERLCRVGGTSSWTRPKTLREKLWKRSLSIEPVDRQRVDG